MYICILEKIGERTTVTKAQLEKDDDEFKELLILPNHCWIWLQEEAFDQYLNVHKNI
jgi:hypothetical protein